MDFLADILVGAIHLSLLDLNNFVLVMQRICMYFSNVLRHPQISVVGDEFVSESVKFSNQSTTFGQAFNDFSRSKKGSFHKTCVLLDL